MAVILVIEDEPQIREDIVQILELSGHEPISAGNGQDGIGLAHTRRPELIVCDVMMPELDGYGVLEALNNSPQTDPVPFIFLTGHANHQELRYGMELGADDYLGKPFTPDELINTVESRLAKQAKLKRREQERIEAVTLNLALSLPHELNTPLNGILGLASLLQEGGSSMDEAEIQDIAQQLKSSGERLYRMTQNFLLYSHLELQLAQQSSQASPDDLFEISLTTEVIPDVVNKVSQKFDRQADITLELEAISVAMHGSDLSKLVTELFDNALKFSPTGTPIIIRGYCQHQDWILEISDQGRGFTAIQAQRISAGLQFERHLREQQGSGLGLAIVDRLAQLHEGRFQITNLSQPTTVSIALPGFAN